MVSTKEVRIKEPPTGDRGSPDDLEFMALHGIAHCTKKKMLGFQKNAPMVEAVSAHKGKQA